MALDKKHLDEFQARLAQRRGELAQELHGDAERVRTESFGTVAGETRDTGDESVADLIADTGQADLSRDMGELRAVERALQRIERGEYGRCVDCKTDIEVARLRVNPAAERCAECQRLHERTHASASGGKL